MLAKHCSSVLSTALNSLVAGLTSLKIWSTKSAKKRHLFASISAHSLHMTVVEVKKFGSYEGRKVGHSALAELRIYQDYTHRRAVLLGKI